MDIKLVNQYKPKEWYTEERINLCKNIVEWIPKYLALNSLVGGNHSRVEFLDGGVSSITCRIDSGTQTYLLKISTSARPQGGEALFLEKWRELGIPVPKIFDHGMVFNHSYTLMEYIDALPVTRVLNTKELEEKNMFSRLGEILAIMHTVRAKGFGDVIGERGEYERASEWYKQPRIHDQVKDALQRGIIQKDQESRIEDFINWIDNEGISTYCHNDFSLSNVLFTEPLTVIDPDPVIHHPFFDVARSIILFANLNEDMLSASKQFLKGYTKGRGMLEVFLGAIYLEICLKCSYWERIGRTSSMARVISFLPRISELYEV